MRYVCPWYVYVTCLGSRIGRAESSDGLTWRRTPGQMPLFSVLDKNTEQWWGFDTAHVGLGDVNLGASSRVVTDSSVYFMYYFGGNYEETNVADYGLTKKVIFSPFHSLSLFLCVFSVHRIISVLFLYHFVCI